MQGFVRTLPASLLQTAVHHLMCTQPRPGCSRLSHHAKWFLKLLGFLPSTTHLLPWRGVLIAWLPAGEDNTCATGHVKPVGLLRDFNKPLWEAEKQGKIKPEANKMPPTAISLCRNLRNYREIWILGIVISFQEHRIFCCWCKYSSYNCNLDVQLLCVVQKAPLRLLPQAVGKIVKIPQATIFYRSTDIVSYTAAGRSP